MPARGSQKRPREGDSGLTALHRTRLVSWSVAAIVAIAPCPDGSAFAAGYENGKVEIFSASTFHCLTTIPGQDGLELSSLAWANADAEGHWRLFYGTLTGDIFEVDCQQLSRVAPTDSYGGAVWALSSCPNSSIHPSDLIAAGCDDGSVRLFSVQAGLPGAAFQRTLAQGEGRCLAVAWHPTAAMLLSGDSDGNVHCWDTTTGQELLRITAASYSNASLCVWALLVTSDGTIVTGDSEGAVQFWDGTHGTLLSRLQRHAADVLALAEWQGTVWAAGVDPRVALFQRVRDPTTGLLSWTYLDHKVPHTHDVRALGLLPPPAGGGAGDAAGGEGEEPLLISGGNDGQLLIYPAERFTKVHPTRQSLSPQAPLLQVAPASGQGQLLQATGRSVSLWQLADAALPPSGTGQTGPAEGDALEVTVLPRHLAQISTTGPSHISCAALSPAGDTIAVSDASATRLFALEPAGGDPQQGPASSSGRGQQQQLAVVRRKLSAGAAASSVALTFSVDGSLLLAADGAGVLRSTAVDTGEVTSSLDLQKHLKTGQQKAAKLVDPGASSCWLSQRWSCPLVRQLTASPNGELLAVATGDRQVTLVTLPDLVPAGQLLLAGTPGAAVTSMAFSPDSSLLVVASDANDCVAYDVSSRQPTPWSLTHQEQLTDTLEKLPGSIRGISFNSQPGSQSLMVYSAGGLCHLDMSKPLSQVSSQKRYRHKPQQQQQQQHAGQSQQPAPQQQQQQQHGDSHGACGVNGRLLLLENPCLLVGYFGPGRALMVEKPWGDVLQQLPPPLYRHRYGS